jgi:hypothetical protein
MQESAYELTQSSIYRKINTSSSQVEDPSILKTHLTKPPVKRIDLHFPLGMEVTARNLKGVTIKDALDAIHKPYKKRVCKADRCDSLARFRMNDCD